ncbi:hypothetical protein [Phytohabitans houttuyneae]|uniref:hypothetical protein n=1 Tax=Phytohabitans houttuyneae TaxID=1076126 RepID=UPI0015636037|nr:hypothetical protein [Phytohabitans houttuyneae]
MKQEADERSISGLICAQSYSRRTNCLWHVLDVIASSKFVLKSQNESPADGYKPLGIVFGIEPTRRRPTRKGGLEVGFPLGEVGTQAVAESQSLGINLDVVVPNRLRKRRSASSGHHLDPASRCWPVQQFSRSRNYVGLDVFGVLGVIVQR